MKNLIAQMWPYEVLDDYIQANCLETAAKLLNYRHKPTLGLFTATWACKTFTKNASKHPQPPLHAG